MPGRRGRVASSAGTTLVRRLVVALAALGPGVSAPLIVSAQATAGTLVVRVTAAGAPLADVAVRSGPVGARTDASGVVRLTLPAGRVRLIVRHIGFRPDTSVVEVASGAERNVVVALRTTGSPAVAMADMDMPGMPAAGGMAAMEAITVTATRSERRVEDEPLRVEVMSGEMLAEQTQMRPRDITMTVAEMGGVRMQQTSSSLGGTRLRINGLRGQYTGLVFDGLPLFGASPDGFTYLQVAPLDLRQVEVIKGAATALYGPSALGGVLNLVSRRPDDVNELLLNQTTRGGSDIAYWQGRNLRDGWGWSIASDLHHQPAFDDDGDGWADFPFAARLTVRPRVYHEGAGGSSLLATVGATIEDRAGGLLPPAAGRYVETLHTTRLDGGITWRALINDSTSFTLKASVARVARNRAFGTVGDAQRRFTAYTEATWSAARGASEWLLGAAWQHDALRAPDAPALDFTFDVPAVIAQHTWAPVEWLATQASARCDLHNTYGSSCSPRVSVLWRPIGAWNARLSLAEGTFAPTPLTDETDAIGLGRIDAARVSAERARTASLDIGGSPAGIDLNLTLAASRIERPVIAVPVTVAGVPKLRFLNAPGPADTRALELFASRTIGRWNVNAVYGYLDATFADPMDSVRRAATLVPKHSLGGGFGYAVRGGTQLTVDAFYTGEQVLENNPYRTHSVPQVLVCLLWVQPLREGVEVWLNGENLLDARQTRVDPLLLPVPDALGRRTTQVWGSLEGRVVNLGLRLKW